MLNWKKLILYPAAVWAVIYLFICAIIGFKLNVHALWVEIIAWVISIVGLYIAAKAAKISAYKNVATLAIVWLAVMFVLDLILTLPFTGAIYFKTWTTYISYAIILIMPLVFAKEK